MRPMNPLRRLGCLSLGIALVLGAAARAAPPRDEWQQPDRVVADLGLRPGMTVADIGCGQGFFTFRLARQVGAQGRTYAVDIDAGALAALKKRVEKEGLANVEVVRSKPESTLLATNSLDAAFVCDVFHEMPAASRPPLVRDIVRAIRPGGFLYVLDYRKIREVTFDPYEKLIPRDDLVRLGTDAGLVLDAEYHYLRYQVFLRFRKP